MQVPGDEPEPEAPASNRMADRDLLWVESVSERLLGHPPARAWERTFFRPDAEPRDALPRSESTEPERAEPAAPTEADEPPQMPAHLNVPATAAHAPFAEGDVDWDQDVAAEPPPEPDVLIDLTAPVRPAPPESPSDGRIDDEIMRLALGSGDTVLANAVLVLLEARGRDRQRISTLETALRALVEQVDRIDAPDRSLATTAHLLRRVVDY